MAVHRPWPLDAGRSKAERQPAPNRVYGTQFYSGQQVCPPLPGCRKANALLRRRGDAITALVSKTNKPPRVAALHLPKTISSLGKFQRPDILPIADRVNVSSEGDRGLQRSVDGGFHGGVPFQMPKHIPQNPALAGRRRGRSAQRI